MPWICNASLLVSIVSIWIILRHIVYPKPITVEAMKKKYLYEVIAAAKATTSRKEKVNILQSNMCPGLAGILRLNFDKSLQLDVDLDVSYKRRKVGDFDESLNRSSRIWNSFTPQCPHDRVKKDTRFVAMLERLEPSEAQLLLDAAARKINLGLSATTIIKCFPEIFKDKK